MLNHLITDFLEYCKVSCYSAKSMEALITRTKEFNRFVNMTDAQSVQELTYVHLLEYIAAFEAPTIHVKKNRVWAVRKFYAFLILHGIVKENIGIKLPSPKIKKTVPKFLTIDDCEQLFTYFSEKAIDITGFRNLIIFLIFCITGVRIAALRSMDVADFDVLSGLLYINEKGGVRRQIALPEALCLLLKEYLLFQDRKSGPLFLSKRGKRIAERTLQMIFRDALVALGINKYFHVHLFRHTAGTVLAKVAGLSMTKHVLGHNVMSNTETLNQDRLNRATLLDLPELDFLELTVIVDEKTEEGFLGDAGISYYLKSNLGSLLLDVGFGPDRPALAHNAGEIGFTMDKVDALAISHLHIDHMGGLKAARQNKVIIPEELGNYNGKDCYLPDHSNTDGFNPLLVTKPGMLKAGIATTGPLARSLFFLGLTEEQALVARVKGKGLVIITACGHPTIELIVEMVKKMSDEKIHAICGGLHFPVTEGRGNRLCIQFQRFLGTGLPPWKELTDNDLSKTISSINDVKPDKVFISAHDSCDKSISRFKNELKAETHVLKAGGTYRFSSIRDN